MDILTLGLIFITGLFVGSFVHVVAVRYHTKLSWVSGRSMCPNCGKTLVWFEMIPLASYIFLGRKCRTCASTISFRYPLVEFLTGAVFIIVALRQYSLWPLYSTFSNGLLYSVLFFFYYAFIFGLLMVIAIYDIRHKIIPDRLVYTFILLALLKMLVFVACKSLVLDMFDILNLLAPVALFIPFAALWFFSGGRWMGFGDGKLAFGIGALLGMVQGISAVVIAFWMGALWSVAMLLVERSRRKEKSKKKLSMQSQVPFAPFLILGTLIAFATHVDVLGLNMLVHSLF